MIVFTLTNTRTGQVYVGTTQDCPQQRWRQLRSAAEAGLESDLYSDIRHCGSDAFTLREWAVADSLAELRQLAAEAVTEFDAISLQGVKTRTAQSQVSQAAPRASAPRRAVPTKRSGSGAGRVSTAAAPRPARAKIASGRSSNSDKEKRIRQALEAERLERQQQELAQQRAQADEMAAIMARIDGRSSSRRR